MYLYFKFKEQNGKYMNFILKKEIKNASQIIVTTNCSIVKVLLPIHCRKSSGRVVLKKIEEKKETLERQEHASFVVSHVIIKT